ncbi:MAG: hypothetical protein U9R02_06890 [Thermodesulfobacteriota bacterium]|nr:hypothetical protein [Thermodesulfobacteriota bacterium]
MDANYNGEIVVSTSNAAIDACDVIVLTITAAKAIVGPERKGYERQN